MVFFDRASTSEVSRAWVPANFVRALEKGQQPPSGPITKAQADRRLSAAQVAETAVQMDLFERRRRFSFVSTYKGKWGDCVDWSKFATEEEVGTKEADEATGKVDESSKLSQPQQSLDSLDIEP